MEQPPSLEHHVSAKPVGNLVGDVPGTGGSSSRKLYQSALDGSESDQGTLYTIVFTIQTTGNDAADVTDGGAEGSMATVDQACLPARLDISLVPVSEQLLHWPVLCPTAPLDPPSVSTRGLLSYIAGNAGDANRATLGDTPIALESRQEQTAKQTLPDGTKSTLPAPYTFLLDPKEMNTAGANMSPEFVRTVWSSTIIVPRRKNRFARVYVHINFRFATVPLLLVLERYNLEDAVPQDVTSSSTSPLSLDTFARLPSCEKKCFGGATVHNGQVLDHAVPSGFQYKIWLIASNVHRNWDLNAGGSAGADAAAKKTGGQLAGAFGSAAKGWGAGWLGSTGAAQFCVEYDMFYKISYEAKLASFELGQHDALSCRQARLPDKLVQENAVHADTQLNHVAGRHINLRDFYGFPKNSLREMEHSVKIVATEESLFRLSLYQTSASASVFAKLYSGATTESGEEFCKGSRRKKSYVIGCRLDKGTYNLIFYSFLTLGGVHPCQYFQMQLTLKPMAAMQAVSSAGSCDGLSNNDDGMGEGLAGAFSSLGVAVPSQASSAEPRPIQDLQIRQNEIRSSWNTYKIPVEFAESVTRGKAVLAAASGGSFGKSSGSGSFEDAGKSLLQTMKRRRSGRNTDGPKYVTVWKRVLTISQTDLEQHPYLKLAVHSDFAAADFRFAVTSVETGAVLLEPKLSSNGYSNLLDLGGTSPAKYEIR